MEVLVIGILILLIFGPERLPELTRGLGTALRRMRETYVAFTQEFKGELEPIAQDINEVTREIRQEVDAIRQAADIRTTGRHDPCVGIRATPIAEAMVALVLMDHVLRHRAQCGDVVPPTPRIAASAGERKPDGKPHPVREAREDDV